jgi:Questin oxidase-like
MTVEGMAYLAYSYDSCHPERATPHGPDDATPAASLLRIAREWQDRGDELHAWAVAVTSDTRQAAVSGIHPELLRSGLQFRIARVLAEGHPLLYETPSWITRAEPPDWAELYYAVALLYLAAPGDFVLLHLVTSLHAMQRIAERLPSAQQRAVVHAFWIGLLGIVFSGAEFPAHRKLAALHASFHDARDHSADNSADAAPSVERDGRHTVARAALEDEEHNPKLVYVLRRAWQADPRSILRVAAAQFTSTPELPPSFEEPPTEEN